MAIRKICTPCKNTVNFKVSNNCLLHGGFSKNSNESLKAEKGGRVLG